MKSMMKSGFTLIELIIVIAILAFLTVVGIHNYGNIREIQAKKVNLANIKRIYHALATYETLHKEEGSVGYFNGFDSLIDVSASGAWYGKPGEIELGERTETESRGTKSVSWDARTVHNGLGIYDGSWKVLGALYNAAGQGSGATDTLEEAQAKNCGMRNTNLYKQLGIYYLSTNDAAYLQEAGVRTVYLHNPSSQQASGAARNGFCTAVTTKDGVALSQDGLECNGGGPGFRPDMSAFYQVYVTNSLPVAMVLPTSDIYRNLGYNLSLTNSAPSDSEAKSAVASTKLIAFGIGHNAECVLNQVGLGEAPYNPYYDKKNYRQYIAIFALRAGGQGVSSTCRLAGVVDCAGNTYKAAEYGVTWTSPIDAPLGN